MQLMEPGIELILLPPALSVAILRYVCGITFQSQGIICQALVIGEIVIVICKP
jgi:hypothetical protein